MTDLPAVVYASWTRRFAAWLVDLLLVGGAAFGIGLLYVFRQPIEDGARPGARVCRYRRAVAPGDQYRRLTGTDRKLSQVGWSKPQEPVFCRFKLVVVQCATFVELSEAF